MLIELAIYTGGLIMDFLYCILFFIASYPNVCIQILHHWPSDPIDVTQLYTSELCRVISTGHLRLVCTHKAPILLSPSLRHRPPWSFSMIE